MALIYEDKVPSSYRAAFVDKVKVIAYNLGIDPNWLMAIMHFESNKTFSPSITNSIGAVGLIQFMPDTAKSLGTTSSALKSMSAVNQLDYVYKYFMPYKSKIKNYIDAYFAVFFPLAIGKPDNWVIQSTNLAAGTIAKKNPSFETNKDGKIEVWEVKKVMLERLPSEWLNNGSFSLAIKAYGNYILIGLIVSGYLIYRKLKQKNKIK